jgi:hypothetical protein
VTHSTEQNPSWEATSSLASQGIPRILCILKVCYRYHKSPKIFHIPGAINTVNTHPSNFIKIHSNIPSGLGLPSGLFPSSLHTKTLYAPFVSPTRATYPTQLVLLHLITQITFCTECKPWSSSWRSFVQSGLAFFLHLLHPVLKHVRPMWFCFEVKWSEVKWSEVSYGEVHGDKSTIDVRVTLYWGYLIVLRLFHLVCVLYCVCLNWFCNVCVCVCVFCNVWESW